MSVYSWEYFQNQYEKEWEEVVSFANDGTMFHKRRFLNYHETGKFEDCSLILRKKGNVFGVLPAAIRIRAIANQTHKWFVSHPGASYGGLLSNKIVAFDEAEEIIRLLKDFLSDEGFHGLEITPPPQCYQRIPNDVWVFTMLLNGFDYRKRDYTQIVPLWLGDPIQFYDNKTLGGLRLSEKLGVVVEEVELSESNWDIFHPMLVENRKKHGVTPAHSRRDLTVLTELMPECLRLYFAFSKERDVVAGTLIFEVNDQVTLTFYIAHDRNRQDLKAVLPLNHYSILQAQKRSAKWLDFGISTVVGVPGYGLIRFKENFGAVGGCRDVYYYEFRETQK